MVLATVVQVLLLVLVWMVKVLVLRPLLSKTPAHPVSLALGAHLLHRCHRPRPYPQRTSCKFTSATCSQSPELATMPRIS